MHLVHISAESDTQKRVISVNAAPLPHGTANAGRIDTVIGSLHVIWRVKKNPCQSKAVRWRWSEYACPVSTTHTNAAKSVRKLPEVSKDFFMSVLHATRNEFSHAGVAEVGELPVDAHAGVAEVGEFPVDALAEAEAGYGCLRLRPAKVVADP